MQGLFADDPGHVAHMLTQLQSSGETANADADADGNARARARALVAALEEKHGVADGLRLLQGTKACVAVGGDFSASGGHVRAVESCNDWAVGELRMHFLVSTLG